MTPPPATMNGHSSENDRLAPPSFFSMGRNTIKVPIDELFGTNRSKVVVELQKKGASDNTVVYLAGGPSTTRFDSDHEPLFRQESYFYYLSGVKEPDCSLCIEVASGRTTLFVPKLPAEYATIMGHIKTCDEWKEIYRVDQVEYSDDIETYLQSLMVLNEEQTNGNVPQLLLLEGTNSDTGKMYRAPSFQSPKLLSLVNKDLLFDILAECRVIKSAAELNLLRHVTELTSFAHSYVMRNTCVGMLEYQSESLFRHYCYYNYGCRLVGYTPICGCGPDAAVLHYGHAGEPNNRQLHDGDICLYDMGAEYYLYGSDVTCSFPANGTFSPKQKGIYEGVLQAQLAVYDMLRPGVSWVDCHKAAEAAILKQLIDIGLVLPKDKTIEELVEMRMGAVFMPHGLGHFIGLDTHDVGGYLAGHPSRSSEPGLKSLRTARVVQPNMVLTVEPGCYFIDHLLDQALQGDLGVYLNAGLVEEYRGFGGVRLEDVVAITEDGMVNYTLCPRTIAEVEHVMAGGKWPPRKDEAPELQRVRLTDPTPLPPPPSL